MELWDIYDENKQPTGRTMKREDWNLKEGEYHLSVLGVILRPDGRFLVTRRAMDKSWAPGWWEVPGGGAVAGEDSYHAILREVREETGLDVTKGEGELCFSYRRENIKEGDNYFVDVYRFVLDFDKSDVVLQEEETIDFMLADRSQLEELGRQGIFLHYNSIKEAFDLDG